jgi:hypothetical protein
LVQPSMKRPKEIWGVALMNIVMCGLNIISVIFVLLQLNIPANGIDPLEALLYGGSLVIILCLLGTSLLVLFKSSQSPFIMMIAAAIFYGILVLINIAQLFGESASPDRTLIRGVLQYTAQIALNVWAVYSPISQQYFASFQKQATVYSKF